jgi:arabinogalactan oligomer/maltooligosaccharide transport system substrate-binding protein
MKKKIVLLIASALTCASLVGCSKTSYDVTLSVWGGEEDQTFLKEVSDSFIEKVHAEEKAAGEKEKSFGFSFVAHSESNVKDDVTKDPNAAGDVIAIADDQLNDFVTAGDAQKISDIDADVASDVEARNSASSVAVSKVNNELYAMPFTPNGFFLYYDSSVLSASDVTDFDTLLNALVEKNKTSTIKYKFSWPTASGWYLGGYFDSFGLTAQINSSTSKTECNWNAKTTSTSVKVTGLAASEAFMNLSQGAYQSVFLSQADAAFASDVSRQDTYRVVAGINGLWNASAVKAAWGSGYAATKLPALKIGGVSYQLHAVQGAKLQMVNAFSKNVGWAVKFADYLTGKEMQSKRFNDRLTPPTNTVASASLDLSSEPSAAALVAQAPYAFAQRVSGAFWTPSGALSTALETGASGDDSLITSGQGTANLVFNETVIQSVLDTTVSTITA